MIRPPTLVLLAGSDAYARQQEIQRLVDKALEPEWRELNLERLDGSQPVSAVLDGWLTAPFWGSCRVIIAEFQGEPLQTLLDELVLLCANGLPGTDNLLILVGDSFDKRRKNVKTLLQYALIKEFQEIKSWNVEKELYPWIEEQVRHSGKRITREAVSYLAQACGTDKYALRQALDKVLVYLGDAPLIERGPLELLVVSTETNIFHLLDLLAARQHTAVFVHLQALLQREPAPKVLSTVATQLVKLFRARWLQQQGQPLAEIAQELGQKPFALEQTLKRWRHYSLNDLEQGLQELLQLQTRTRSARAERVTPEMALELWLGQMLRL
ncbi:MAG: DNA polymerase III subunit delta [Candidatus Sericytochromatia bacterium]